MKKIDRPLTPEERALVEENEKLVPFIANKYDWCRRVYGSIEDAIGDGYIALCIAAQTYDAGRGYAFTTYASKLIFRQFAMRRQMDQTMRRNPGKSPLHLDWKVPGKEITLGELVPSEKNTEESVLNLEMARSLKQTADALGMQREYGIALRVANGETLAEISREMGITRERVRQLSNNFKKRCIQKYGVI